MIKDTIILKSELQFREYIINNSKEIQKIFVFEDLLDDLIFFYGFTENKIIAAKEKLTDKFSYYQKLYNLLSKKIDLQILNKPKVLKLIKRID